jgi:hypothetical protein
MSLVISCSTPSMFYDFLFIFLARFLRSPQNLLFSSKDAKVSRRQAQVTPEPRSMAWKAKNTTPTLSFRINHLRFVTYH